MTLNAEDPASGLRGRKVLVTGASGFIGRRLAAALCAAGADVTAIGRTRRSAQPLAGLPLRFIQAGLGDAAGMAAAVASIFIFGGLAERHNGTYVPAHMENGKFVPGKLE